VEETLKHHDDVSRQISALSDVCYQPSDIYAPFKAQKTEQVEPDEPNIEINQSMRNMISKWYDLKNKCNDASPDKNFLESPKGLGVVPGFNISRMLEKNGEDHFLRMNS
jgi:hypothetical protein